MNHARTPEGQKEYREFLRDLGRCPRCSRPVLEGRSRCRRCLRRHAAAMARYRRDRGARD